MNKRRRNHWKKLKKTIIPRVLKRIRRDIHNYRHRHIFKLNRLIRTDLTATKLQEDIRTIGFE